MAFQLEQSWVSGNGQGGDQASDDIVYILIGTAEDHADVPAVVQAYAEANVDETYGGRAWTTVRRDRIGDYSWLITATYGNSTFTPTGGQAFTFKTGGGTQKVKRALKHVRTYGLKPDPNLFGSFIQSDNVTTDQNGWLNVNEQGDPDGIDLPTGAFEFQVTLYLHPDEMTAQFVALLFALTYTTNGTPFTATVQGVPFTFAAGECLFKGATGSLRGYGDWEITLEFAAQPTVVNRDFGDIKNVNCKGWEYLSFKSEKRTDASGMFIAPKLMYVFVDQVFAEDNWTGLLPTSGQVTGGVTNLAA